MMAKTILIVDNDADLLNTLSFNLRRENNVVRQSANGAQALSEVTRIPPPDLVILDLQLPDISGFEICRRIRSNPITKSLAILMLTAKGDEIDRVAGFEVGIDDYVVKPFSMRELMLRIRALLRRTGPMEEEVCSHAIHSGAFQIDTIACRVWVADDEIQLTALEYKTLLKLFEKRGYIQTREEIISTAWKIGSCSKSRTVDTVITRLREKLGTAGDYIETIRGKGYRFKETL